MENGRVWWFSSSMEEKGEEEGDGLSVYPCFLARIHAKTTVPPQKHHELNIISALLLI